MTAPRTPALDRARAWVGAHVRWVDALTALGWTGVASLFAPTAVLTAVPLTPWIIITVLCGLALAARRTAPEATVTALGVLMVAHVLVIHAFTVTAAVAVFSAAYTAHSLLGPRWRRWATVAMLAGTAWAALSYSREVIDLAWYLRGPIVLAHWVPVGFFCLLGALGAARTSSGWPNAPASWKDSGPAKSSSPRSPSATTSPGNCTTSWRTRSG